MNAVPVLSLQRGLNSFMDRSVPCVELRDDGLYQIGAYPLFEEMSPEEIKEYEACMAEPCPYGPDQAGPPPALFKNIEDAADYGRAMEAMDSACADLHAYAAPSECYSCLRSYEEAINVAWAKAVQS